tara:strand:- start:360 stop:509 length:150 start_codon:yes stop_codon:yes gene_type:complete
MCKQKNNVDNLLLSVIDNDANDVMGNHLAGEESQSKQRKGQSRLHFDWL